MIAGIDDFPTFNYFHAFRLRFPIVARTCRDGPLYESFSVTCFVVCVGMGLIHNSLQEDSAAILAFSIGKYSEISVFPFLFGKFLSRKPQRLFTNQEIDC